MKVKQLIKDENIFFLKTTDKIDTINTLIDKARQLRYVDEVEKFRAAVFKRENIVGTGIGCGIALPHVKMDCIDNFFIITGLLKNDIDWGAIDKAPVKASFLIGGPSNDQKQYLEILSGLTLFLKDEARRDRLFTVKTKKEVLDFINEL